MTHYDLGSKLNGRNYSQWFLLLTSHLRSDRFSDYITIDAVNNTRNNFRATAIEAAPLVHRDDEGPKG